MEPSNKVRDAIAGLTPEEVDYEISLGNKSRFKRNIPELEKRQRMFVGKQKAKDGRWDLIKKLVLGLVIPIAVAFVTKLMGLY